MFYCRAIVFTKNKFLLFNLSRDSLDEASEDMKNLINKTLINVYEYHYAEEPYSLVWFKVKKGDSPKTPKSIKKMIVEHYPEIFLKSSGEKVRKILNDKNYMLAGPGSETYTVIN